MSARTDADLSVDYVELREVLTSGSLTVNVHPNDVNGMVEFWIDPSVVPPAKVAGRAVANLRWTPDEARALAAALVAAADTIPCYAARTGEGYWTCDVTGGCSDCRDLAAALPDPGQLAEWDAER